MNSKQIDGCWKKILALKTPDCDVKHQASGRAARAALSFCHGSADGERGISYSAQLMTSMQARSGEWTLNANAFAADALCNFENKPELVLITKKFPCLARSARASYGLSLTGRRKDELEKEKLEAEKKETALAVQDLVQMKHKIAEVE